MKSPLQAADSIRNLARLFKDMGECVEALESVGKLDQAIEERKKILAQYDGKIEQVRAAVEAKEKEMVAMEHSAGVKVHEAHEKSAATLIETAAKCNEMMRKAQADAELLVYKAGEKASELLAKANKALSDADTEVKASNAEVALYDAELVTKRAELAELEAKIASAKEAVRQLLS